MASGKCPDFMHCVVCQITHLSQEAQAEIATTERSSFLQLPTELRNIIYDHLAQCHKSETKQPSRFGFGRRLYYSPKQSDQQHEVMRKHVAITQVSRQIRQESLPILYRELEYIIFINKHSERTVRDWLEVADPLALASIRKVDLAFVGCYADCCVFSISLGEVDRPVVELHQFDDDRAKTCVMCEHDTEMRKKRDRIEELVKGLPLSGKGTRREMDVETLVKMMKVVGFAGKGEQEQGSRVKRLEPARP